MEFSKKKLSAFQSMYKDTFGIPLSEEEAYKEALGFLQLLELIINKNYEKHSKKI